MTSDFDRTPPSALSAGLGCRCPRCGRGRLFDGYLTPRLSCEVCGLDYGFADSGDGPAFFVTGLVGFTVVLSAMIVEFSYEPPLWLHALLWLPLLLGLSLALMRPAKGLLIALQYRHRAREGRLKP